MYRKSSSSSHSSKTTPNQSQKQVDETKHKSVESIEKASQQFHPKQAKQRRKLKNDNLDLMLKSSEILLEDFIELEVQFIGKLKQISKKNDISIKSVLLNLLKDAQNRNNLPKILTPLNDSILRINAYILELLTRDTEEMINAIPVHNISNVIYVKEAENSHLVVFQSGDAHDNEFFDILIIVLNTEEEAEVICKLLKKCFELLCIERTMSLLDQVIGDEVASNCSTSISVAARKKKQIMNKGSNIKVKNIDNVKSMVTNSLNLPQVEKDQKREKKYSNDAISINTAVNETIEDFIKKLQLRNELNKKEYEEFGLALAQWQKGLLFEKFCNKAMNILGPNRIQLLTSMTPFVPEENLNWFKKFIRINDSEQMCSQTVFSSDSSSSIESNFKMEQSKSKFYFTEDTYSENNQQSASSSRAHSIHKF